MGIEDDSVGGLRAGLLPGLLHLLLDERQFESDVRRKIAKLLVPYVRVAVRDPGTSRAFAADLAAILDDAEQSPVPTTTTSRQTAVPEEHR